MIILKSVFSMFTCFTPPPTTVSYMPPQCLGTACDCAACLTRLSSKRLKRYGPDGASLARGAPTDLATWCFDMQIGRSKVQELRLSHNTFSSITTASGTGACCLCTALSSRGQA